MNKQQYLLICLAEECAEVIKVVNKALRFGLENGYPGTCRTNLVDLNNELNDVLAVVETLDKEGVKLSINDDKLIAKQKKVYEYMEYSRNIGVINDE